MAAGRNGRWVRDERQVGGMTAHRSISMPTPPWEGGAVVRPVHSPRPLSERPAEAIIRRAFTGKAEPQDVAYLCRAMLQMSDELAELRERVRGMEMGLAVRK